MPAPREAVTSPHAVLGGSTPGRLLPWEVCMQSDKNPPRGPVAQKARTPELARTEPRIELLRELVAHLRQNRTLLRDEGRARIAEAALRTALTRGEIFAERTSGYDTHDAALGTGTCEARGACTRTRPGCSGGLAPTGPSWSSST